MERLHLNRIVLVTSLYIMLQCIFPLTQAFTTEQPNSFFLQRQTHKIQRSKAIQRQPTTSHTASSFPNNNESPKTLIQQQIISSLNDLDSMYTQASSTIKCPFFRRRAADTIDNLAMILRFLVVRHKTLLGDIPLFELEVPGCKAVGRHVTVHSDGSVIKHCHLSLDSLGQIIQEDWSTLNHKGYYITGRLNSTIYKDDCLFDGPDPDMPVRGLRKYLAAASHLFDASKSFAKLLDLEVMPLDLEKGKFGHGVIIAKWRIEGVLMLPWRPKVQPWTGYTKYHIDKDGLIALHEEKWDISVLEAFLGTAFPTLFPPK